MNLLHDDKLLYKLQINLLDIIKFKDFNDAYQ